jgi:anti-sigma factor (TIGR02949 family)
MTLLERLKRLLARFGPRGDVTERTEMISCEQALSAVYEYLDGELEPDSREQVTAHFEVCARCHPHLRLEESFRATLRDASGGVRLPEGVRERVLDLIGRSDEA